MIKAIETKYKGYRFRSRLEARWAIFFDTLDIKWEYELEGFEYQGDNETFHYLPDFYLPELKAWAEVKPDTPDDYNRKKHIHFSLNEQKKLFINLVGSPQPFHVKDYALWSAGTAIFPENLMGKPGFFPIQSVNFCYDYIHKKKCFLLIADGNYLEKEENGKIYKNQKVNKTEGTLMVFWWGNQGPQGSTWELFFTDDSPHWPSGLLDYNFSGDVSRAIDAARSARFEHGESPFVK